MLAPQHLDHRIGVEPRIQRVAGDVRDGFGQHRTVDLDQLGKLPAAERALVDEAQRGAVVEQRRDPDVIGARHRADQHLTAHPEVHHQRLLGGQHQPQILAASAGLDDPGIEQPGGQVRGPGLVPAHRAGVVHPHRADRAVQDVVRQAATNHLHLGQFRHVSPGPAQSTP